MITAARKAGRPVNPELIARRKEDILTVSMQVFARCGYRNTDVQEIANLLVIGKGTIYRYFPTKKDLFFAAVDRGMHLFTESIKASADTFQEPLDRLAAVVVGYLRYFDTHPELVELIIQERAEFRDRERPSYFVHREQNIDRYYDGFRLLVEKNIARDLAVPAMFDSLTNMLYGTMFTNFFNGRVKSCEAQAQEILDVYLNGILQERRTLPHFEA